MQLFNACFTLTGHIISTIGVLEEFFCFNDTTMAVPVLSFVTLGSISGLAGIYDICHEFSKCEGQKSGNDCT